MTGIDLGRVFPQETIGNDLNRKPWIQFPVYAIGMVVGYMLHETDGKLKITNVRTRLVCSESGSLPLRSY